MRVSFTIGVDCSDPEVVASTNTATEQESPVKATGKRRLPAEPASFAYIPKRRSTRVGLCGCAVCWCAVSASTTLMHPTEGSSAAQNRGSCLHV